MMTLLKAASVFSFVCSFFSFYPRFSRTLNAGQHDREQRNRKHDVYTDQHIDKCSHGLGLLLLGSNGDERSATITAVSAIGLIFSESRCFFVRWAETPRDEITPVQEVMHP